MTKIVTGLVVASALTVAYMVRLASSEPVVRRLDVHFAGWPAGAAPIRLVLASDLHVSSPGDDPSRPRSTVAMINRLKPDLVLLAGDYVATGI